MILGELEVGSVSPAMVGGFVLAAAVIIPTLSALLALFITRREADAMTKAVTQRIEALEEAGVEERHASTVSRARLHERVEKVEKDLGQKLDAKIGEVRSELGEFRSEVSDTLRRQPSEIVALLRNTQSLHSHQP